MSRIARVAALVALIVTAACGKETCNEQNLVFTYTENLSGIGPTTGQPVARIDVTQNYLSHTPYAACTTGPLQDVGVVDVTLTGTATTPIKLVYDLQGLNESKIPAWGISDTVPRLAPGEKITHSRVTVTPVKLENGARVVVTEVTAVP